MNISLTKELEKFIHDKVKSGMYGSASEFIRDCVRRMRSEDTKLEELRHEIDLGLKDIKEGRVAELDIDQIIAKAKALHAKQKRRS